MPERFVLRPAAISTCSQSVYSSLPSISYTARSRPPFFSMRSIFAPVLRAIPCFFIAFTTMRTASFCSRGISSGIISTTVISVP